MWSVCTMDYYLVIGKNQLLVYAATWMNLTIIMLSERIQTQKTVYSMIPFTSNSRKGELIFSDRKQISDYLGLGVWQKDVLQRRKKKLLGMMTIFYISRVTMVSQVYTSITAHQIICFKWMYLLSLYLSNIDFCVRHNQKNITGSFSC